MKGTIDATLPDAEQLLMQDTKEAAEHATIVDLIRNAPQHGFGTRRSDLLPLYRPPANQ